MTEMNWYATQQLVAERNREIERQARRASELRLVRATRRGHRRTR